MKLFALCFLSLTSLLLTAQTTIDFENFELEPESFLNGDDQSGGFTAGDVFLTNTYDESSAFWFGWAISNDTDITSSGFTNQYSAITAGGDDDSENFAVCYDLGGTLLLNNNPGSGAAIQGFSITNNTYPFLSMRDGDSFSKQFGGATGNDPDWFLLTIRSLEQGVPSQDSVAFYLADYRFDDNGMDYIVDTWEYVDLSSLNATAGLVLTLSSSDVGQFGMNTPAYFCVDNIVMSDPLANDEFEISTLKSFPNPTNDFIYFELENQSYYNVSIFNSNGILIEQFFGMDSNKLNVSTYPAGSYIARINADDKTYQLKFMKH